MKTKRLEALDLARFSALIGMIIVNFKLEVLAYSGTKSLIFITDQLEGKSAALFVVLAGIGIALMAKSGDKIKTTKATLQKRGVFLSVIGFLNCFIYNGDILHIYGVFLLVASLFIGTNPQWKIFLAIFFAIVYVPIFTSFNYDTAWDWKTFEYADFFTVKGYLRNLFFNGFFPVIPWLTFIFLGLWLGTQELAKKQFQNFLITTGLILMVLAELTSRASIYYISFVDEEVQAQLADLLGTDPIPPLPLYLLMGAGFSLFSIGLAFKLEAIEKIKSILTPLILTGRQTLTLYVAHIFLVIIPLQYIEAFDHKRIEISLLISLFFLILATIYCHFWSKKFKHGPVEMIMRSVTG